MACSKYLHEMFLRRLYAKGKLSINDMVLHMKKNLIPYSRGLDPWYSGGALNPDEFAQWWEHNWHLYHIILEELCFSWWLRSYKQNPGQQIVPVFRNKEEETLFLDFEAGHLDFSYVEETEAFDNIQWKFAPGWRKRYKEIPVLEYINF